VNTVDFSSGPLTRRPLNGLQVARDLMFDIILGLSMWRSRHIILLSFLNMIVSLLSCLGSLHGCLHVHNGRLLSDAVSLEALGSKKVNSRTGRIHQQCMTSIR
jgi:hypothetical protein